MKKVSILFLSFIAVQLNAAEIVLQWDRNPEIDIDHYTLKYGTVPGVYTNFIEAGNLTEVRTPDLAREVRYYFVVSATNKSGLVSENSFEITYIDTVRPTSPYGWQTKHCDSEETGGYEAEYAFDGNPNTFWHTEFPDNFQSQPHELQIDLGANKTFGGFSYLPRQDSSTSGNVKTFDFLTSTDGITWTLRVSGTIQAGTQRTDLRFPSVTARYISFKPLSEQSGNKAANIAEINLLDIYVASGPLTAPSNLHFKNNN